MSFLKILKVLTHESIFFKVEILPQSRNPICPFHFSNIIHWFNSNTTTSGISNHCEVSRHILCLPSCCQSWSLTGRCLPLPLTASSTQCTLKTSLINVSKGSNYLAKNRYCILIFHRKTVCSLTLKRRLQKLYFCIWSVVW